MNFVTTLMVHPLSAIPLTQEDIKDNNIDSYLMNVITNNINQMDSILIARQKGEKALRDYFAAHNAIKKEKSYYYLDSSFIVNFSKPLNPDLKHPMYSDFLSQLKYAIYQRGSLDMDILVFDICVIYKKYPIAIFQLDT